MSEPVAQFQLPGGFSTIEYTWNIRAANNDLRVVVHGNHESSFIDATWLWWVEYRHIVNADKSEWRRLLSSGAESAGGTSMKDTLDRAAKVYHEDWRYLLCEAAAIDMRSEPQVLDLYRRWRQQS